MLPADLAPAWGFVPPRRRGRGHGWSRNVARWVCVLRLASLTGEVRSADLRASLNLSRKLAHQQLVSIEKAGLLVLLRRELRPGEARAGGRPRKVYGLTAAGRVWLANQSTKTMQTEEISCTQKSPKTV